VDVSLTQSQRQVQKLSPMMRQSLEILQMPTGELDAFIRKECAKNPTIEIEGGRKFSENSADAHREMLENVEGTISLEEHLLSQVPDWGDAEKRVLVEILKNIDGRGFFCGDLGKISNELALDLNLVESVYVELKALHPWGIGARDLRECLLAQLEHGDSGSVAAMAKTLVDKYFDDLQYGRVSFLVKKVKASAKEIVAAGKLIARLNFSPISGFSCGSDVTIISDIKIFKSGGEWLIKFNGDTLPAIRFSKSYREMLCTHSDENRETLLYLRRQAAAGKRLCDAINRRRTTLMVLAEVILKWQLDFFENGPKFMKPLRLKDASVESKLHISTISRAVRGKYIATPHGIYEMAKFFGGGLEGSVSQSAILERILEIAQSKKCGLSDAEIAKILGQRGINIARRTVAKYRKMVNIPNSRIAKQFSTFHGKD
jgi:RNA polymerase sigma-54 factor